MTEHSFLKPPINVLAVSQPRTQQDTTEEN